ncbi:MAG: hypothetical protein KA285_00925 [Bacteroidia bacterium]|nr:hypothetical protein [Bacteroidia bacterium]
MKTDIYTLTKDLREKYQQYGNVTSKRQEIRIDITSNEAVIANTMCRSIIKNEENEYIFEQVESAMETIEHIKDVLRKMIGENPSMVDVIRDLRLIKFGYYIADEVIFSINS